ncbi:hypothetical protein HY416_04345 [Candidatus Kaiserbacteria bacterium]|nr:hypothetical protein [Candidatus Kaiserbacteria bacterium]
MSLRSPLELLNDTISFYNAHAKTYALIVLVPAILGGILSYLSERYLPPEESAAFFTELVALGSTLWILLSGLILGGIVSIIACIALIFFTADPSRYPSAASAYSHAKTYFFPYLFVGLLTGLAIMGGMILLIVPGIVIAVWFAFSQYTCLLEEKNGFEALRASRTLVVGRWGAVFTRLLVFVAIYILATFAFMSIIDQAISDDALSAGLSNLLLVIVLTPISTIYPYLLYKDLKAADATNASSAS